MWQINFVRSTARRETRNQVERNLKAKLRRVSAVFDALARKRAERLTARLTNIVLARAEPLKLTILIMTGASPSDDKPVTSLKGLLIFNDDLQKVNSNQFGKRRRRKVIQL
jgi:hypothetical protein